MLAIVVFFIVVVILGYIGGVLLFEPSIPKGDRWLSLPLGVLIGIGIVCMFRTIAPYFIENLKESYTRLHKLINSKEI